MIDNLFIILFSLAAAVCLALVVFILLSFIRRQVDDALLGCIAFAIVFLTCGIVFLTCGITLAKPSDTFDAEPISFSILNGTKPNTDVHEPEFNLPDTVWEDDEGDGTVDSSTVFRRVDQLLRDMARTLRDIQIDLLPDES